MIALKKVLGKNKYHNIVKKEILIDQYRLTHWGKRDEGLLDDTENEIGTF